MTSLRVRHIATLLPLVCASVAHAQADPAKLVGCYRFSHQPYRLGSAITLRVDTVLVRLDSTVVSPAERDAPTEYALFPSALSIGDVRATHVNFAPVWFVRRDSLVLSWNTSGLGGPYALFAVRGDTLRGEFGNTTDVRGTERPPTPITGRRVPCASR